MIAPGDQAPDFELPDQDGNPVRLSEAVQNGPVVLFWYPIASSGGCTKQACHFRDLASEFSAAGAQRFGISTDSVAKQKQFSDENSFDYPLLSDESGSVAETFGIKRGKFGAKLGAPVKRWTFVIGKDRRVVKAIHSEMNMELHADEALAAAR